MRKLMQRGAAVLLLASASSLAGCTREAGAGGAAMQARPPAAVTVAAAATRDVPVYLDEIGRCVSREVVTIQAQAAGTITALHFKDGQDVKKGDLLFTIDKRPYQAQLDLAEATLQENLAQLELAKVDVARAARMVETKAGTEAEYDAKRAALAVAEARVHQSHAQIDAAKVNLGYCEICSPIDGRAGQRLVDPGNVVSTSNGGTQLLVIQRQDPIHVDFTVTEAELARVRKALEAGKLTVEARLPEFSQEVRRGELTFLDSSVQDFTGTVKLRATMENKDRFFWPGQFVRVRLVLGTKKDAVLVPGTATQLSQQGPFVFLVKSDSTVELRQVKAGQRQGDEVVIEEGLAAGDRVVLTGQLMLYPGAPVQVVPGKEAEKP
jgi:multidrug efflux system membrane fusion protein